ncbi:hypothetical protein CHELA20_52146 [Hyphomicrobiales bacterium]|nr:hypothetical protein CHELA41_22775 [Hyphomicrobiales bacterium]CAH1680869.1 hypothetical protein CHELA20_52146 [Hyphomicrobiales bacterium]
MSAPSRPLVMRVAMRAIAQQVALLSGRSAAKPRWPDPGRTTMTTPMKPTMIAAQRRQPTFSPRIGMASAVTSNGETKEIDVASAIGRKLMAVTKSTVEPAMPIPRTNWIWGQRERKADQSRRSAAISSTIAAKTPKRIHEIWKGGRVSVRYFDVPSPIENNIRASENMRMPRRDVSFTGADKWGDAVSVRGDASGRGFSVGAESVDTSNVSYLLLDTSIACAQTDARGAGASHGCLTRRSRAPRLWTGSAAPSAEKARLIKQKRLENPPKDYSWDFMHKTLVQTRDSRPTITVVNY